MANFNKVLLVGNLTRDPELKSTPSNQSVAQIGLAVNRNYQTKDGEKREETTFVDYLIELFFRDEKILSTALLSRPWRTRRRRNGQPKIRTPSK